MRVPRAPLAVLVATLALSSPALARMYQWVSPASGRVQLSGDPPAWYRSPQGGPRVWVYENGSLVDDTAIALPHAQREALRESAFEAAEERRRAEALKRLERAARREQRRQEEAKRLAALARAEEEAAARAEPADAAQAAAGASDAARLPRADELAAGSPIDDATVERLKAIIREFDSRGGATR